MTLVTVAIFKAGELQDGTLRLDERSRWTMLGALLGTKELVQTQLKGLGDSQPHFTPTASVLGMLPHGEDGKRLDDLELGWDIICCDARERGLEKLERVQVAIDLDEFGRDGADGSEQDAIVGVGLERLEVVDMGVEQRDDGVESIVIEADHLGDLVVVKETC